MGPDSKAADERDSHCMCGPWPGDDIPANPYPSPDLALAERDGYPFAIPQHLLEIARTEEPDIDWPFY